MPHHLNRRPYYFSYSQWFTALVLNAVAALTWAQNSAKDFADVRDVELQRIEAGVETQRRIESLDDQRLDLLQQYRGAVKQHNDVKKYNQQLRNIIASQENEAESLKQQINRIGTLERDIVPLMSDMLDALENFIELDLPFLIDERRNRIHKLRQLMNSSNVSNSEKYRRILEAYQIENDYGRSIEARQSKLTNKITPTQINQGIGEQSAAPTVNFLKVGRLAYFYQTLDGKQSYHWSPATESWQALDSDYNSAVSNGIKIAKEQMAPDLLLLPIELPAQF